MFKNLILSFYVLVLFLTFSMIAVAIPAMMSNLKFFQSKKYSNFGSTKVVEFRYPLGKEFKMMMILPLNNFFVL